MLRSFLVTNRATGETRTFHLNDGYSDSIKVNKVDGLDPVESTVLTAQYAIRPGGSYQGTITPERNIVLTLKLDPDYSSESVQALREEMYLLFQEQMPVRLSFTWDSVDDPVVFIDGYVDKTDAPLFVQEPIIQISIICPYPYFTSASPQESILFAGDDAHVAYVGDIRGTAPTPYEMRLPFLSGKILSQVSITFRSGLEGAQQMSIGSFTNNTGDYVSFYNYPGDRRFAVMLDNGDVDTNLLYRITQPQPWPDLIPKKQSITAFTAYTNGSFFREWYLLYTPRFKGL